MEELTKMQIILLTLLVSFVTSIATGIITTSLLAQAPTSVTNTINRVVERTIEKVTPTTGGSIIKEVTVINEDDAITSSINKILPAVVRIQTPPTLDGSKEFYAVGIIVSKSGLVLSDKRSLIPNAVYSVILASGATLSATIVHTNDVDNIATFQIQPDSTNNNNFPFVVIAENELNLGQTVIGIGGKTKNSIQVSRATGLNTRTEQDSRGKNIDVVYSVDTNISGSTETAGAPLINLSGELVGIKASAVDTTLISGIYITINPIKAIINLK